jgi:hypothetical protein
MVVEISIFFAHHLWDFPCFSLAKKFTHNDFCTPTGHGLSRSPHFETRNRIHHLNSSTVAGQGSSRLLSLSIIDAHIENSNDQFQRREFALSSDSGGEFSINSLLGIQYISGIPDGETWIDNSRNGGMLNDPNASGAGEEIVNEENKSLTGLGIGLISVGSVAIVTMLLVGTAKSTRGEEKAECYMEFY